MAVSLFTQGVNFSGLGNLGETGDLFKNSKESEQITQVLGASINPLTATIQNVFSAIPAFVWPLLAVEILSLIVLGIVVSLISSSWAQAALIQAIQICLNNQQATIRESSEKAFSSIKSLIWLRIVPNLIFVGISLVGFTVLIVGFVLTGGFIRVIFGILLFALFLIFLYFLILLNLIQIWAQRIAVLDKKSGKASFASGYKIAKKKFWSMLLLGLINTIFSGIVYGIPFLILIGLIIGALSLFSEQSLIAILIAGGVIFFIVITLGFTLLSGLLTAFKASIWTVAYNNIRGKYNAN